MEATQGENMVNDALTRAAVFSPFLKLQLKRFPNVTSALGKGRFDQAMTRARAAGAEAQTVAAALRRERSALALALGVADLAGAMPLEQVIGTLSDFADDAVERALQDTFAQRTPDAEPLGFAVLALGKHGSRELNYSSDVDLLFLFDPETLPLKPREDAAQAAVRIGQRLIETLQKRDAEGYVFRVDMRLRPTPEVTPVALPVNAAISYYETSALPWERAAFIRARAVAGDMALSAYFLDAIHPFVWRRSLDFGAIGEVMSITGRIRDHYAQGQAFGPGFDLKRGRGGIREIEFFAQVQQLIHGGREPALRAPATLDALRALRDAGKITPDEAEALSDAYQLFRTIEHRLQMVDDRQTHSLPEDNEALDNVAHLHGLGSGDALLALLREPVTRVAGIYDTLRGEAEERLPQGIGALEEALLRAGMPDPAAARMRIESWRSGKARSLRTQAARDAFEAMLPGLIRTLAAAPDPARALNRFDDIVARLPSGINFFRLLEAQPELQQVLAAILSHAPALADQLGRRPELLDGLISKTAFEPPPPVEALIKEFRRAERGGEDYQLLLDRVRRLVNERRFALGVQLITGAADPIEVAGGYARVAEAAVRMLADAAVVEFEEKHGRVPGSELLILALGRLGGEGLTQASDLDLIYLFTGSFEAVSDGPKPLGATEYFNRLAQRVTAALNVQTAAGPLYEVDTRLRPSGADGLLAVSLDSFAEYQAKQAWTWEHMALTRARPVYGSGEGQEALQQTIDTVLNAERDAQKLLADAAKMRTEMAQHKPPQGPLDVKLGEGGLVDLEFAVHTLQLKHRIAFHPRLERAIEQLIAVKLVPPGVEEAHFLLARILVTLRLVSPDSAIPPEASQALVARVCGQGSWDALLAAQREARQRISGLWRAVKGEENAE
ncbi:MAG TPA: bifunctional [glutamine synthetase] adenylyltransferase/[glutamine synthetase]-adenylyl-L-tyrosine phosphorylase [Allosphingosinicella sp.]|uniref:bifunctional [glutamine synthetase] adenylyltransferase/[glutamine synthetase]-adenylyl-L-tyrosine phosphorylase n=1 Tax=Allosphingosinicella sp. TaxID=2823234 RepID=UPI002EDB7B0D